MTAFALNNLWTCLDGLSLSQSNHEWIADELFSLQTNQNYFNMTYQQNEKGKQVRQHKLLFLTILLIFVCIPLMAYDFKVDGVAYNVTSLDERTVEVTSGDNYYFYSGDVVIPPTVTYEGTSYTVTSIGNDCFQSSPMISISLPTTLRVIHGYSFNCCYQLKSLTVPEGVEKVEGWAIGDCKLLESVSFPSTMVEFASTCFAYCPLLKEITVASGNPKYESTLKSRIVRPVNILC